MTCERCGGVIPVNEMHHPYGYCSYECEKWHKQELCKHTIQLEGIRIGNNNSGMETKDPIYFCPGCLLDWEK